MPRLHWLPALALAVALTACGTPGGAAPTPTGIPQPAPIVGSPIVITAEVGTVEPVTLPPPGQFTPVTYVAPTPTPIPTIPGGLGPTELKYRVLAKFPDFFFCDPDYYPIAFEDELTLALQKFPELQANAEEFNTILAHNNLTGQTSFTDDQKLLIYREHKKLAAIYFEAVAGGYQFTIQVAKTEGEGELITGQIDGQGQITVLKREKSFATCPICLAADTLIDTPHGPIAVQDLRVGMLVWTVDQNGARVARPLLRVGKTVAPASHQVIHMVLDDGRELWVSPGHPLADGRAIGRLRVGDWLDGAAILSVERLAYSGYATYDLLPAGDTGYYWANGILLASTLTDP